MAKNYMTKPKKAFCFILGLLLCLGLLGCSILMVAYDKSFYMERFSELSVAEDIGISEQDLSSVTKVLIDYMKGSRDNLDTLVQIDGVEQAFFNERECSHMADVQRLFAFANLASPIFLIPGLLLALFAAFSRAGARLKPAKPMLCGIAAALGIIALVGAFAAIDFNAFWTAFHKVFFTNELWLLNPATDNLIVMLPEEFFSATVTAIIIRFGIGTAFCAALAFIGVFRAGKKPARRRNDAAT